MPEVCELGCEGYANECPKSGFKGGAALGPCKCPCHHGRGRIDHTMRGGKPQEDPLTKTKIEELTKSRDAYCERVEELIEELAQADKDKGKLNTQISKLEDEVGRLLEEIDGMPSLEEIRDDVYSPYGALADLIDWALDAGAVPADVLALLIDGDLGKLVQERAGRRLAVCSSYEVKGTEDVCKHCLHPLRAHAPELV